MLVISFYHNVWNNVHSKTKIFIEAMTMEKLSTITSDLKELVRNNINRVMAKQKNKSILDKKSRLKMDNKQELSYLTIYQKNH